MRESIRLFVTISSLALWQGGLTFYAAFVVPTANEILVNGEQGFVTQEVTNWLNLIGLIVVLVLLANAVYLRSRLLWGTWFVLTASVIGLFVVHRQIDAVLNPSAFEVLDNARFRLLHERYLIVVTIQWIAGLATLWLLLATKSRREVN
jgi:hypothetical protein